MAVTESYRIDTIYVGADAPLEEYMVEKEYYNITFHSLGIYDEDKIFKARNTWGSRPIYYYPMIIPYYEWNDTL